MKVIVYKLCELYNAGHYSVVNDVVSDVMRVTII